jgi:NTE family protein
LAVNGLVLGGGGVTGIAWELGILTGLAAGGSDLTDADLIIGTSAGAVVAAQITSGIALVELLERQIRGYGQEISAKLDTWRGVSIGLSAMRHRRDPREFRRRIGTMALATETVPESDRIAVIASRLPSHEWPERDIRIVAVDAATGEPEIFTRASGVPLINAVAASCAVPGVWPPATIGGRRFIDGGMRSAANADLAAACDRIVMITPITLGAGAMASVKTQADALRAGGAEVTVISPDEQSEEAIGSNPLDPAQRAASASAGRVQGASLNVTWSAPG